MGNSQKIMLKNIIHTVTCQITGYIRLKKNSITAIDLKLELNIVNSRDILCIRRNKEIFAYT